MKRILSAVLCVFLCVLALTGCNAMTGGHSVKYSFYGENEYFSVSNGEINLGETEEVFDGGSLNITQSSIAANIASFSTTFYTVKNEERIILLSNSTTDLTGGSAKLSGGLGTISGSDVFTQKISNANEWTENLWFELSVTYTDGTESTYPLQLTVRMAPGA